MTRRIQRLVIAVAAFAALALGGAVFAQAQSSPVSTTPATSAVGDNVQSGDQSTPDQAGATAEQTAAENPEQSAGGSESAPASDGPGGHADEPGNANADHQFQGND